MSVDKEEFDPETVKRWDEGQGERWTDPDGYWVLAEDYDKLLELYRKVKPKTLVERIAEFQREEAQERAAWSLGDYSGTPCENCGRQRVCKCPNGKHRCEKCNWVPEDRAYAPASLG